ncbi:Hypothetical protein FKW44_002764, partial [Caligus rogercresseyi]
DLQQCPQSQDPRLHQEVPDIFEHDPSRSQGCRQGAGVSHVTLLACVNEDLRCHSYKLK